MNRIVRTGFTFIEIAMATLVMALALLPIFGMIQGGLVRSDISVSYSAATELASALMNQLMSDVLPFDSIPETPGGKYLAADGRKLRAHLIAQLRNLQRQGVHTRGQFFEAGYSLFQAIYSFCKGLRCHAALQSARRYAKARERPGRIECEHRADVTGRRYHRRRRDATPARTPCALRMMRCVE